MGESVKIRNMFTMPILFLICFAVNNTFADVIVDKTNTYPIQKIITADMKNDLVLLKVSIPNIKPLPLEKNDNVQLIGWQDELVGSMWDNLTDAERRELDRLVKSGVIDETNAPGIIDRFYKAPRREGALAHAMREDFWSNVEREVVTIGRAFADPEEPWFKFAKDVEKRGWGWVAAETVYLALAALPHSVGVILRGELGYVENPIETIIGLDLDPKRRRY